MTSNRLRLLQGFLWMVCAFHILVGVGLNMGPGFAKVMAGYYGASVEWTPQFTYILKPLGAFMLVLGLLAAAAARDPLRHKVTAYGFVVLFTIRALQRLVFRRELLDAFSISPARNLGNVALFLGLAAVLFALVRAERSSSPTAR